MIFKNKFFIFLGIIFSFIFLLKFSSSINNNFIKDELNYSNVYNNLSKNDFKDEPQDLNCLNIPKLKDGEFRFVTKIIDGDTFLIEGGYSVRILGIDADEMGYICYEAAKNKLEELILNKKVKLEKGVKDLDKYCRYLRYVFIDNKNVSEELVRDGLAIARFDSQDLKYKEQILKVEKFAYENKIGCKWNIENIKNKNLDFNFLDSGLKLSDLKTIKACDAEKYYNQRVIVEGKVAEIYFSKNNNIFLNFEKPYPKNCFTAVIFNSNKNNFKNDLFYYKDKFIRIYGIIKKYKNKPQIILENESQIEIKSY